MELHLDKEGKAEPAREGFCKKKKKVSVRKTRGKHDDEASTSRASKKQTK